MACLSEDAVTTYAHVALSMFVAEGIACGQRVAVASAESDPSEFLASLPALADASTPDEPEREVGGAGALHIAWRYRKYVQPDKAKGDVDTGMATPLRKAAPAPAVDTMYCHTFDLKTAMAPDVVAARSRGVALAEAGGIEEMCSAVLEGARALLDDAARDGGVARVALLSVGSPMWCVRPEGDRAILRLLHTLRGLIRTSLCACIFTFPAFLFDAPFVNQVHHLSDIVLGIESFAGSPHLNGSAFPDLHGFFNVAKLCSLNTAAAAPPRVSRYGFKLKRKKLAIEELHLPPEDPAASPAAAPAPATAIGSGSGSASDDGGGASRAKRKAPVSQMMCAPGPGASKLEF